MTEETAIEQPATQNAPGNTKTIDLFQPRTVVLSKTINEKDAEFRHEIKALTDDLWLSYQRALNPRATYENGGVKFQEDVRPATNQTYAAAIAGIPSGYAPFFRETLTPEGFCEKLPFEHKEAVVDHLFNVQTVEGGGEFFFDDPGRVTLETICVINGSPVTIEHSMAQITVALEKEYENLQKPVLKKKAALKTRTASTALPHEEIAALYDRIATPVTSTTGIPIWVKISALRFYFTEYQGVDLKN